MDVGTLKVVHVGNITGNFFVPAYQRGYRWGEPEVRRLLQDLLASGGRSYYLQPIVVRPRSDGSWELIDGQQRLTTLYLLLTYIRERHIQGSTAGYSISYETRPGSKEYLDAVDEALANSNIDFFHMYGAYKCIEQFFGEFGHRATHEVMRIFGFLFDSVKVLWYEVPSSVDSTELFTRLNVGRIPLTDAELVKALLLSRSQRAAGETDRAIEIATHWDSIERDLREPEVWAFVTGGIENDATRISLLLDTLAGVEHARDAVPFRTFELLAQTIEADPIDFWRKVVDLHSLILGWFEDRSLYHKVGYLIAVGVSFREIVEMSQHKGRRGFESALDERIRQQICITNGELAELTYHSKKTSDVLLLMNVETIRSMTESSERYSFSAHAAGEWSLEHIHAQNAEPLQTVAQWTEWLQHHRGALDDLPHVDDALRAQVVQRIDDLLLAGVSRQPFELLEKEVTALFTQGEGAEAADVHSISNLALLNNPDNSALSNSVFEVKRRLIIQRDRGRSYIPVCTRNVFLKYYTADAEQQLHFWSAADRKGYLEALRECLEPYLIVEGSDA